MLAPLLITRTLLCVTEVCRFFCSYGGWIIDGFPVNKDQWSLFLERGKNLPDNVIFLQDESLNGDLLIKRWYLAKQVDISGETEGYHNNSISFQYLRKLLL